jgi:hypothetical protein
MTGSARAGEAASARHSRMPLERNGCGDAFFRKLPAATGAPPKEPGIPNSLPANDLQHFFILRIIPGLAARMGRMARNSFSGKHLRHSRDISVYVS